MRTPLNINISTKHTRLLASTPEPQAKRIYRCLAFLLDMTLGTFLIITLLMNFILPQRYSKAFLELKKSAFHYQQSIAKGDAADAMKQIQIMTSDKDAQLMFMHAQSMYMLLLWIYFTLCDALLKGRSLGKRVFKLKVISIATFKEPNFMEISLRSMLKVMSFGLGFPLSIILGPLNLIIFFFNKDSRSGHDLMAKTVVVEDNIFEMSKEGLEVMV